MSLLRGVVPMLPTPFGSDGAVDAASLCRLVSHQLEEGADGLAILGLAGEGTYLSVEERERVTAVVFEAAGGAPVLVGCTAETTDDAARLAADAASRGAAGVMVAPPKRPDWSSEQVRAHYRAVARAADCELMVQDAPGFIGVELGVELVLELAEELDNVRAYKVEALPFWENAARARAAAGDRLRIFGGHGGLYQMDVLDSGADGLIPGADTTAQLSRAWRAAAAGDRARADAEYRSLLPFLVYQMQSLGLIIGGAKTVLQARGVIATAESRHPQAGLSETTRERLLSLARSAALLQ
ncbi:MAG: dihydrodipicolinate synthase family protein [Actinobacteria bacterium]|nr:dihydrodipicolinate synthase family protein [Actinomycetota bacterium]